MNELEAKLDRLVDGELTREEYAVLLSSLEGEKEGWRKCALAFLEAQALRTELRGLLAEPSVAVADVPTAVAPRVVPAPPSQAAPAPLSNRMWAQWTTLAASLLLTFWLGRGSVIPDSVTTDSATAPTAARSTQPRTDWAESSPRESLNGPLNGPHHGRLTLMVENAQGESREVELPVVNGDRVESQQLLSQQPQMPREVVEAFRASGHEIECRREVVPFEVEPGRTILVPVDHVRVVPIRKPTF